jgi:hypothetical protein
MSQGQRPVQRAGMTAKQRVTAGERQRLLAADRMTLAERVREEMAQDPGLLLDSGPDLTDRTAQEAITWDPDLGPPPDEWEDGQGPDRSETAEEGDDGGIAGALEQMINSIGWENDQALQDARKAVREFERTGRLPAAAPSALQEALARLRESRSDRIARSVVPTFQVTVQSGQVTAMLRSCLGNTGVGGRCPIGSYPEGRG